MQAPIDLHTDKEGAGSEREGCRGQRPIRDAKLSKEAVSGQSPAASALNRGDGACGRGRWEGEVERCRPWATTSETHTQTDSKLD
jgi:hypothetical protein